MSHAVNQAASIKSAAMGRAEPQAPVLAAVWSTSGRIGPQRLVEVLRAAGLSGTVRLWGLPREGGAGRVLTLAPAGAHAGSNDLAREPGWGSGEGLCAVVAVCGGADLMVDPESGRVLALTGCPVNARSLLGERVSGVELPEHPGECLLGLLSRRGPSVVQEVAGEWSMLYWDAPAKRLTLGCDRIGANGLYHCGTRDGLAVASVPGVALALANKRPRVAGSALLAGLAAGECPVSEQGQTVYTALQRVRPGGVGVVVTDSDNLVVENEKYNLLENFIDQPVDPKRLQNDLQAVIQERFRPDARLGLAWTGEPGDHALAALLGRHREQQTGRIPREEGIGLFALEDHDQPGRCADPAAERVAADLGLKLHLVPWPDHAAVEQQRARLVRAAGLPLVRPFPALQMGLLARAMREQGVTSACTGRGARSLLGVSRRMARQAAQALERRRRILPALLVRRALDPHDSLGTTIKDGVALALQAMTPRPYRSTREQANIELLSHHAPGADRVPLLEWYKSAFSWREMNSLRRMQVQRLTRSPGPARHAALTLAANLEGVRLTFPLLDHSLARYLRLPLSRRLHRGRECPLLLDAAACPGASNPQAAPPDATIYALASVPARDDAALLDSPLLGALFADVPALLEDLRRHRKDERFRHVAPMLDALVEWERLCGVVLE